MVFRMLAVSAVILLILSSLVILVSRNWRISMAALGLQYLGVFGLVVISWPLELSFVKVIAGLMVVFVLTSAILSNPEIWLPDEFFSPSGIFFRMLSAGVVLILVLSEAVKFQDWVPEIQLVQAMGCLILFGMGLLQLGLTVQPVRVVIGLLTVFSGFEVLYSALETSTLVAGLFAAVNLGLALAGAYLFLLPSMEEPR